MHICYVDESGDAEALLSTRQDSSPVFSLVGVTVPGKEINGLTWDFLQIKKTFNPSLESGQLSDLISFEMKGASLRRDVRQAKKRNARRRAFGIMDAVFNVLEEHNCQLLGKFLVKTPDVASKGDPAIYANSIAQMAESFQAQLAAATTEGMMVLDARTKVKNTPSVMGVTTRRFRAGGSAYPNIVESPVFGHSDTHVPLQIADLIASAVVFPIACAEYCSELTWNAHPHPNYHSVKLRYGARLQGLEYRYINADGQRRGGFQVIDSVSQRPTHLLFRD